MKGWNQVRHKLWAWCENFLPRNYPHCINTHSSWQPGALHTKSGRTVFLSTWICDLRVLSVSSPVFHKPTNTAILDKSVKSFLGNTCLWLDQCRTFTIMTYTPQNNVQAQPSSADYCFLPASPPHPNKLLFSPQSLTPPSISASNSVRCSYRFLEPFAVLGCVYLTGYLSGGRPTRPRILRGSHGLLRNSWLNFHWSCLRAPGRFICCRFCSKI